MNADAKAQIMGKVEASPGSKPKVLSELGVSKSAYHVRNLWPLKWLWIKLI